MADESRGSVSTPADSVTQLSKAKGDTMQDLIVAKTSAVLAIGKAVVPPMAAWFVAEALTIDEGTKVPITILVAAGGACWHLNGRFTKIENKIKTLSDSLDSRPCQIQKCTPTKEEE